MGRCDDRVIGVEGRRKEEKERRRKGAKKGTGRSILGYR